MAARKLTAKQTKFRGLIYSGLKQIDAYKKAYDCSNMSDRSISREVVKLMNHPLIATSMKQIEVGARVEAKVDATYVLNRFTEIDQMDVSDILNDDWTLKVLSEWPKVWRTYLSSFDIQEVMAGQSDPGAAVSFIKKIKWPDKLKNLELLGKHKAISAFKGEFEGANIIMPTRIELVAPGYTNEIDITPSE